MTEIPNSPFPSLQHQTIGISFSPFGTPSSLLSVSLTQFGIGTTIFDFNRLTGQLSNIRFPSTCITPQASITYSPDGLFVAAGGFSVSLFSVGQSGSEAGNLNCIEVTPVASLVDRSIAYRPLEAGSNGGPYYLASLQPFPPFIEIFTIDRITGLTTESSLFSIFEPNDNPRWTTFSPDGNFLANAIQNGVEVREFIVSGSGTPDLLPLSGSISRFFTPTSSGGNAGARSVDYSPNGKWLAVANGNSTISIFTVNRNTGVLFNRQNLTVGHIGNFGTSDLSVSVAFAPNSCFLAVSNRDDNTISVYKRKSHNCIACTLHHNP